MTDEKASKDRAPYNLCLDRIELYDDFVDFHDTCSFFCDALSTILAARTEFDEPTLEGIRDFSDYLAHKGTEMKERFRQVQQGPAARE